MGTVDRRPIARRQLDQVVAHDGVGLDLHADAVASHAGPPGGEGGDAIERPLGPQLLHDADEDVEPHGAAGEERVAQHDPAGGRGGEPEGEGGGQRGEQGDVEDGEDVLDDDVAHAPAAGRRCCVDLAAGAALGDLGVGEAGQGRQITF